MADKKISGWLKRSPGPGFSLLNPFGDNSQVSFYPLDNAGMAGGDSLGTNDLPVFGATPTLINRGGQNLSFGSSTEDAGYGSRYQYPNYGTQISMSFNIYVDSYTNLNNDSGAVFMTYANGGSTVVDTELKLTNDGTIVISVGSDQVTSASTLALTSLITISVTLDYINGTYTCYVDGTEYCQITGGSTNLDADPANLSLWPISLKYGRMNVNGGINKFRVFNKLLTTNEIQTLVDNK